MSDIKEALVHSEQNAIAAISGTAKLTKFPVMALPAGMEIHDLEQYQSLRNQFRGRLKTHLIKDFLAYVNQQNTGSCFVDSEEMEAMAIFDIGTIKQPEHCKHRAIIALKETAAYRAMLQINGERLDQQTMAEFMEDWDCVTAIDEKSNVMETNKAIHAVRNVKIDAVVQAEHGVGSFSTNKSAIEEINAAGKDDAPLPTYLNFTCVPFLGLSEYTFLLRISMVISRNKEPEFLARVIKLDEMKEEMNQEFFDLIEKDINDEIQLYTGYFNPSA